MPEAALNVRAVEERLHAPCLGRPCSTDPLTSAHDLDRAAVRYPPLVSLGRSPVKREFIVLNSRCEYSVPPEAGPVPLVHSQSLSGRALDGPPRDQGALVRRQPIAHLSPDMTTGLIVRGTLGIDYRTGNAERLAS